MGIGVEGGEKKSTADASMEHKIRQAGQMIEVNAEKNTSAAEIRR